MKHIDKLLQAFRDGVISQARLERDMGYIGMLEEFREDSMNQRLIEKLIEESAAYPVVKTPEEVVIEQESQQEILEFLSWLREVIGEKDWELFYEIVVEKRIQREIGVQFNLNQSSVSRKFERIQSKIKNVLQYFEGNLDSLRDCLTPPQSTKVASGPSSLGYPQDFLQAVNIGGHWGVSKQKKEVYISEDTCLIPEYLEKAFGNEAPVCTMCEGGKKCRRLPEKNNSSQMITSLIS